MRKPSAIRFFYSNAGYSYDPKTETRNQGRWRCARSLAKAEQEAKQRGFEFQWQDDWTIADHVKEFDTYTEQPSTCETCLCLDEQGNVLASLGCIDDASNAYRRVIEAELASEAIHTIKHIHSTTLSVVLVSVTR
jgi:hypothetical protein